MNPRGGSIPEPPPIQRCPMLVLGGLTVAWVAEAVSRAEHDRFIHDMMLGLIGSSIVGAIVWVAVSSEAGGTQTCRMIHAFSGQADEMSAVHWSPDLTPRAARVTSVEPRRPSTRFRRPQVPDRVSLSFLRNMASKLHHL